VISRRINAEPGAIFAVLADPAGHTEIDGSGMLRGAVTDSVLTGVGDVFVLKMYFSELGDYEMANRVVQYELNRRITWEPRRHDIDEPSWEHRWGYELTPDGDSATIVTEIFDCSRWPERERGNMDNGRIWIEAMTETLQRLDEMCTGRPGRSRQPRQRNPGRLAVASSQLPASGVVLNIPIRSGDPTCVPRCARPFTMRAAAFARHGGPDVIRVVEGWPEPELHADGVVVAVEACALNHLDVFVRRGMPGVRTELPHVSGGDVAGRVTAVGGAVGAWSVGDRVLVDPAVVLPNGSQGALGEGAVASSQEKLAALPAWARRSASRRAARNSARRCGAQHHRLGWGARIWNTCSRSSQTGGSRR
jgi:Alcohol dehydrogenase GroES-like domain